MASDVQQVGLLPKLWDRYLEWSGRYSGNAVFAIFPLILGMTDGYKLVPVLVILFLLIAAADSISRTFKLEMNSWLVVIPSLCFVSIYLLGMESPASSLYWMAGVSTYQPANILLLFTLGLFIQLAELQKQGEVYAGTLVALIAVIAVGIGINENNMMVLISIVGLGLIIHRKDGLTTLRPWLVLLAISLICVAVVLFAPGNAARESTFPLRHVFSRAISGSLDSGLGTLIIWLSNPVLLVASLLAPFGVSRLYQLSERSFSISNFSIVAMTLFTAAIPFLLQFPAWWSMGRSLPPRIVDGIFFVFLTSWFVSIGMMTIGYTSNRRPRNNVQTNIASIALLVGTASFTLAVFASNRFQHAQHDLFELAKPFHEYMLERHEIINDALKRQRLVVIVPDFEREYPLTIYFSDIMPFSGDWRNVCYASYYGLKTIQRNRPLSED